MRLVDVAEQARVSRTTASFVLNGRAGAIPPETCERVLAAARDLGYLPNATARALATGRTNRLGLVLQLPEAFGLDNAYFVELLRGMTEAALKHGRNLLWHSARHGDWQLLHDEIVGGESDGVLLVGRPLADPLTQCLIEGSFPTVCVSYEVDHPDCVSVDCDNERAAYEATRYLLDLGHRDIALFYTGEGASWGRDRRLGALRAMREAGLAAERIQLRTWHAADPRELDWQDAAVRFLQTAWPRPTGLLFCEEEPARLLMERLPNEGIQVPRDLAIVGFNSTEISRRACPPLTSVYQPLREIGRIATEKLLARIEGQDNGDQRIRLPCRLDVRESCGAHTPASDAAVVPANPRASL